jgi:signal transduction histidine kinase/CheY-like chemotaxis protein
VTPKRANILDVDPENLRAAGGLANAFVGLALQAKLIIGGLVFQFLVISLIYLLNAGEIRQAMHQQLTDQADQYRPLVRASVSTSLLQRDYVSLQEQLNESVRKRGLIRIIVFNPSGTVVAVAGEPELSANHIVFTEPVDIAGEPLGRVQFVMSSALRDELLADIRNRFLGVAAGMLLSSVLLLVWLANRVSAPLQRLKIASQAIREGRFDVALHPRASDEIGELTVNFAYMAQAIHAQIGTLRENESSLSKLLSEAQHRQHQLEDAIKQAQIASAAKSDFLAKMSHEIRTPMNGVLGMLDVLQQSKLDADQRQCTEIAHRSGLALLHILNEVLDMAKIESGALTIEQLALELRPLLSTSVGLFSNIALAKSVTVSLVVSDSLPHRSVGDAAKIRQVLNNLLSNAVKFTEIGAVTLSATFDDQSRRINLDISDTGIGMSSEQLDHVFEPFVQGDNSTTRRFGGTGLGLSISKELVEAMGGSIKVSSELGVGTRFSVSLPHTCPSANIEPSAVIAPPRAELRGHILIAEDNETNQLLMRRIVAKLGLTCEIAADGEQALNLAKSQAFDALLLDCQMPVMDGYEVARRWRSHEASNAASGAAPDSPPNRLPIIAISADALPEQRQKALDAGMDEHLPKPISIAGVQASLSRWLGTKNDTSTGLS